jgi:cyclophilin family peptidyl-prolyl cis-trans isomerase
MYYSSFLSSPSVNYQKCLSAVVAIPGLISQSPKFLVNRILIEVFVSIMKRNTHTHKRGKINPIVYFDITMGSRSIGRIEMELYANVVHKTAENFRALCTGSHGIGTNGTPLHFRGCLFHRVIPGFMAQCGDFTRGDGTGGESIYGNNFADENFEMRHSQAGLLSMANSGPNTNGSQFFMTFKATPHLDGRHVVFGRVVEGMDVLSIIEKAATDVSDRPKQDIIIQDCGQIHSEEPEREEDEVASQVSTQKNVQEKNVEEEAKVVEKEEPEIDIEKATSSMSASQKKLFMLRMKINAGRKANKEEVEHEYRRMQDSSYAARQAKEERLQEQKKTKGLTSKTNAKWGAASTDESGVLKQTLQQSEVAAKANSKKAANARSLDAEATTIEDRRYDNYSKQVRRLPTREDDLDIHPTSSDIMYGSSSAAHVTAAGLQRLEDEMKAQEERQHKRKKRKIDTSQAASINAKNDVFVRSVNKAYDKYTVEIKQNLERGSAI